MQSECVSKAEEQMLNEIERESENEYEKSWSLVPLLSS